MRAYVGTSGWNFDAWKGKFYPEDLPVSAWLRYYAEHMSTVEINYTFYRVPTEKTFDGWGAQTPEGFRFALKAPQRITHRARLKEEAGETVTFFCERSLRLADRRGPILFQLPPNLKKDADRLRAFVAKLPPDVRAAFEFRHVTWLDDETFEILRTAGAALCIAESEDLDTPLVATAPFGYLRLRKQDYDEAALDRWAERIRAAPWPDDVFVYFKHEDEARGTTLAAGLLARLA